MSKAHRNATCFYCDTIFATSQSAIGDHFPLPKRYGGTLTVPCCQTCHSAKDRIKAENWSLEMLNNVAKDFPKLSPHTRIFLAKCMALFSDALNDMHEKEHRGQTASQGFGR